MNLVDKILAIYPTLDRNEFATTINLQDDSDGKGAYIKEWTNTEFAQPTEAQLAQFS
jgi:hypothetical protein